MPTSNRGSGRPSGGPAGQGDLSFGTPNKPPPVAGGGGNTPPPAPAHFTDPSGTTTPDGWYSEDGGITWKDKDGNVRSVNGGTNGVSGGTLVDANGDPINRDPYGMPGFLHGQKYLQGEADRHVNVYGDRAQQDYANAARTFDEGALALKYQKDLAAGNDPRVAAAWKNSQFAADQGLQGGLSRAGAAPGASRDGAMRAAMLGNSQAAATTSGGALGAQLGLMGQGQDNLARTAFQRSQQASKLREGTLRQDQFGAQFNDQRERFYDSAAANRMANNREIEQRNADRAMGTATEREDRRAAAGAATLNSIVDGGTKLMSSYGKYAEEKKDPNEVTSDPRKKYDERPLGVHSPAGKKKNINPLTDPGFATFPWETEKPKGEQFAEGQDVPEGFRHEARKKIPGGEAFGWDGEQSHLRDYGIEPSADKDTDKAWLGRLDAMKTSQELKSNAAFDKAQARGSLDKEFKEAFPQKKAEKSGETPWGLLGETLAFGGGALASGLMMDKWANAPRADAPLGSRLRLQRFGVNSPADKKTEVKPGGDSSLIPSWLRSLFTKEDIGPHNNTETYHRPAEEYTASGGKLEKPLTVSKNPSLLEKTIDRNSNDKTFGKRPIEPDPVSDDEEEYEDPSVYPRGIMPWLTDGSDWDAMGVTSDPKKKQEAKAQGFAQGLAAARGTINDTTDSVANSGFDKWYADWAKKNGLDPNPDDPQHFYDYRAAYRSGAKPDKTGHWPSEFKKSGHPREFLPIGKDGAMVDTKTGKPVAAPQQKDRGVLDYLVGDYGFDVDAPVKAAQAKEAEQKRNAGLRKKGLIPPPPGNYEESMAGRLPPPPAPKQTLDSVDVTGAAEATGSMASRLPPPPAPPGRQAWADNSALLQGLQGPFGVNSPAGKKKNIELQSDEIKRELQAILSKQGKEFNGLESLKTRERGPVDYVAGDYGFDPDDIKPDAPPPWLRSAPKPKAHGAQPGPASAGAGMGLPSPGGILPEEDMAPPMPSGKVNPADVNSRRRIDQSLLVSGSDPDFTWSDPKKKTSSKLNETDIDKTMDTFVPFSFKYKDPADSQITDDPKAAANDHPGIMADLADKGPFGDVIVDHTPNGMMLRGPQMISALAASVGRLHERLRKQEEEG
jgi:hypothetical protein